jgi:hypothetical protein
MHYDDDEADKGRKYWIDRLTDFKTMVTALDTKEAWRDCVLIDVKGTLLLVCGGSSWGDDPGGGYTLLTDMLEWPDLLKAGGFDA